MERNQRMKMMAVILFAATVVLFSAFFLYMGIRENVDIYSPRHSPYYGRIINLTPETLEDETAPMGVRTVYSWLMDAHCETGDFLCFYVSNNHVDVTVDGELIYALHSTDEDPVGRSVSSNWCIIPLEPEDAGKRFTIQLTPLIADIVHKDIEFLVGSDYNIVLGQLRVDAPQLILAMMCIAFGLIIFLIQCYLQIFSGSSQWELLFMGVFSIILGIWRITDIRSAPLIFSGNPKLLGYISISMLFLASPALLQFISIHFQEQQAYKIHILTGVISLAGVIALAAQVFGNRDIGESLHLSHIALCAGMVLVVMASYYGSKGNANARKQLTWRLLPLLAVGIALDFFLYYTRNSSSDLIYTCLFFLIYLSITFISSFRETSRMVYRDKRTGLFNKARWNELMADTNTDEPVGILVMDMNGLKKINDTLGHEAGDRVIMAFADTLKSALPSNSVICRWGGDEFTVMLPKVNRKKMSKYTDAICQAVEDYNKTDPEARIYFAMGEALSEEHPQMSRSALFHLADERMYQHKQQWYADQKQPV